MERISPRDIIEVNTLAPDFALLVELRMRTYQYSGRMQFIFAAEILHELDGEYQFQKPALEDLTLDRMRARNKAIEACSNLGHWMGDESAKIAVADCAHDLARQVWSILQGVNDTAEFWEGIHELGKEHPMIGELERLTRGIASELGMELS